MDGRAKIMAKRNLVSGLVMLAFGLIMLVYVIPHGIVVSGNYTISPALLPRICAIGITGLAAALVIQSWNEMRAEAAEQPEEASGRPMPWLPAIVVVAVVTGAVLLFRYVNAGVAVVSLVAPLMLYMGERRWPLLVGIPAALLVIGYLLFYEVLGLVVQ